MINLVSMHQIMLILIGIIIGYALSGIFNLLMMWKTNGVLWNGVWITFNKIFCKQKPDPNYHEPHDEYAGVLPTDYYSAKYSLKTNNAEVTFAVAQVGDNHSVFNPVSTYTTYSK